MSAQTREQLGAQAWRAFHRIRTTLLPPLIRHLSEHSGISEADYQVIVGLTDTPGGQLKPSELARELGWDMGRLSHQVSRMEVRGLVAKTPCPIDARSCWIGLTKEGQALARRAIPLQAREVQRLFADALTADQMRALVGIASAIEAHLANQPVESAPRSLR